MTDKRRLVKELADALGVAVHLPTRSPQEPEPAKKPKPTEPGKWVECRWCYGWGERVELVQGQPQNVECSECHGLGWQNLDG